MSQVQRSFRPTRKEGMNNVFIHCESFQSSLLNIRLCSRLKHTNAPSRISSRSSSSDLSEQAYNNNVGNSYAGMRHQDLIDLSYLKLIGMSADGMCGMTLALTQRAIDGNPGNLSIQVDELRRKPRGDEVS